MVWCDYISVTYIGTKFSDNQRDFSPAALWTTFSFLEKNEKGDPELKSQRVQLRLLEGLITVSQPGWSCQDHQRIKALSET